MNGRDGWAQYPVLMQSFHDVYTFSEYVMAPRRAEQAAWPAVRLPSPHHDGTAQFGTELDTIMMAMMVPYSPKTSAKMRMRIMPT